MQERSFWLSWAQKLQHWKVQKPVAFFLESTAPLNIVLAQMMYMGQPWMGRLLPANQWKALAELLENQVESREFASFLREENTRCSARKDL